MRTPVQKEDNIPLKSHQRQQQTPFNTDFKFSYTDAIDSSNLPGFNPYGNQTVMTIYRHQFGNDTVFYSIHGVETLANMGGSSGAAAKYLPF